MTAHEIVQLRLVNQQIAEAEKNPARVVARLGAMQAQDYPGLKWSVALRTAGNAEKQVEQAIGERKIVRSWLMRGTLHLAAAEDLRWLLQLFAPRIIERTAKRRLEIGLSDPEINKCEQHMIRALQGGRQLTRDQLADLLRSKGIPVEGPRSYHIFWRIALGGLICFGLHEEKQPTFVLLEEWVPKAKSWSREEALAELAKRYFTSHGPATLKDFIWWSGLKTAEAKAGVAAVAGQLEKISVNEVLYYFPSYKKRLPDLSKSVVLLPGFDEYLLGYGNRGDVLEPKHAEKIVPGGNGVFKPTLALGGRVSGTWKRTFKKDRVEIEIQPFGRLDKAWHPAIHEAAGRYAAYAAVKSTTVKFIH